MQLQTIPGINGLPSTVELGDEGRGYLVGKRSDGLTVFFDLSNDELSKKLNQVRAYGTKEQVIKAVGFVRGIQIARNYAEKHCPEMLPQIEKELDEANRKSILLLD